MQIPSAPSTIANSMLRTITGKLATFSELIEHSFTTFSIMLLPADTIPSIPATAEAAPSSQNTDTYSILAHCQELGTHKNTKYHNPVDAAHRRQLPAQSGPHLPISAHHNLAFPGIQSLKSALQHFGIGLTVPTPALESLLLAPKHPNNYYSSSSQASDA